MKRISDTQLARLGSMQELRAAERKITRELRAVEDGVKAEYEAAVEAFSWRDALQYGFTIVDNLQSIVRYLGKGLFSSVVSSIAARRRRWREHKAANNGDIIVG